MAMAFASILSMFTTLPVLLNNSTEEYLLPHPRGKYNVSLTTGPLVDNSVHATTDPPRSLMLSVFQPATCQSTLHVPYMPDVTAEYQGPLLQDVFHLPPDLSIFKSARLPVCPQDASHNLIQDDYPILLFSPGYTIPRLYYSVIASAIASEGFTVITIDHPEDANIISYPDGHTTYNNDTTQNPAAWKSHLPARVTDTSCVIDQLSNATAMAELLPQRGHYPLPADRIAMLGHSLGGVTAVIAASKDPRIRGAINWDGTFVESPPASGMHQPVLLMSREAADDATWPPVWPLFEGPKLWVKVADTLHETFSDVPTLLQASGKGVREDAHLPGIIEPSEMVKILVAYTTQWMKGVFTGEVGGPLLEGHESARFPEVSSVMRENF